tara:strand:+ start:4122 stop:4772 length:651 start_codon:yes stop_codon:yes gene_type:complete
MAIKEKVEIRFTNPKKTNSVTCNPYYDTDGTYREIKTPEGIARSIRQTTSKKVLDLGVKAHREEYEFLKDHPFVVGKEPLLKVVNNKIESEKTISTFDLQFEALKVVKDLQGDKLADFARVSGITTTNTSQTVIKAKLYEMAEKYPNKLIAMWDDKDRAIKALLHKGRESGVFKVDNKTKAWKYNQESIGTTLEHAVQWIKDNKDLMPSIRKQLKA